MSRYKKYKATYQAYYQAHKEEIDRYHREWRKKNRERCRGYARKHRSLHLKAVREWRRRNPEKHRIHRLIIRHLNDYPLDSQCVFCGDTSNLEHAHLDYEDEGHNYVTSCHACNLWMSRPRGGINHT